MPIKEITKPDFQEAIKSEQVILVDFHAEWCGPCKTLKPILEEVSEEGVKVFSVDVDNNKELATEHQISSIPTVLLYKNGEKMDEFIGVKDKEEILSLLKKHS